MIRAKKNFRCRVLNRICTERPQVFHTLTIADARVTSVQCDLTLT
jgi:hypothetical protein